MRNKLLMFSMLVIVGIVGCTKEEETAVVSPAVEQVKVTNTATPVAPAAANAQTETAASNQVAPAAANAVAQPAPSQVQNVQPQEQSSTTVEPQPAVIKASPLVTANEASTTATNQAPATTQAAQVSELQSANSSTSTASSTNLTPSAPVAAGTTVKENTSTVVAEQPSK